MRSIRKILSLLVISMMAFLISGCGDSEVSSGDGTQIKPVLVSMKTIARDTRPTGVVSKAAVIGFYSNGTTKNISDEVTVTSSDTNVAEIIGNTLSRDGKKILEIETKTLGTTTITASKDGVSYSYELTVTNPQLIALQIERADTRTKADGNLTVGQSVQAIAMGIFNNGEKGELANVTWTTDGSGTVAVTQTGLITAKQAGNGSVTASLASTSGTISDTVSGTIVAAPIIKELVIDGENEGALGQTLHLKALLSYNPDQLPYDVTNKATWSSDNPNIIVTNGEIRGEVYAKNAGDATITATYGDMTAKYAVHFSEAVPVKLEIQESYYEGGKGKVISGQTVQLELIDDNATFYEPTHPKAYYPTAWAIYSDGTKRYVNTEAFWWSDNQDAVYVNFLKGSFVFGRDLATNVKVTAYWNGLKASFYVDVVKNPNAPTLQSIELKYGHGLNDADITGKTVNLAQGDKFWVTSYGRYNDGSVKNINSKVFYSSSDNSVAWIFDPLNSNVHARRNATGDANITVTWQGKTAYTTVHVIPKEEIGDANSAKNAASLNGVLYPVVLPVMNAIRTFARSNDIDSAMTNKAPTETVLCDENNASRGTYTISRTDNKVVIDYGTGTCLAKNAESVTVKALEECGMTFLKDDGLALLGYAIPSDSNVATASYYVLTEGQITCTKEKKDTSTTLKMVLDKHKSEMHNHSSGKNSVWTHDMTISVTKNAANTVIYGSGEAHGILYDGAVGSGTVLSDEVYAADKFTITVDMQANGSDKLVASGKIGYLLNSSYWYPGDAGKVYTIGFDGYTYTVDGDKSNTEVSVDGKIAANCMGATVQYETTDTLIDDESNQDVNESRIPESGQITLSSIESGTGIVTNTQAFQTFSSSNPRTSITVDGNRTDYDSWRDITTTSECAILQEFIDRALDR